MQYQRTDSGTLAIPGHVLALAAIQIFRQRTAARRSDRVDNQASTVVGERERNLVAN
jgi:hypothetical protein